MNTNEMMSKEFEVVKRGYDPDSVKRYLAEVANYVNSLETDKVNMMKKLEVLARKVEEYKRDEESIQEALLDAQKLKKSTLTDAQEKADTMVKEAEEKAEAATTAARQEAERMLTEAKNFSQDLLTKTKAESERQMAETRANIENIKRTTRYEIEKEQTTLLRTQREVSKFKKELLDIYRTHIDLIQKLPDDQPDKTEEGREVRELQKNIYQQKVEEEKADTLPEDVTVTEETIDTANVMEAAQAPEAAAEQPAPAAEEPAAQPANKFAELKFGGNN